MDILEAGHVYHLASYDGGEAQTLTFLQRTGAAYPGNTTAHPGTNCQEVLRALIDRTHYLGLQAPCAETDAILGLLQSGLLLFEVRAARRQGRSLTLRTLAQLSAMPPCPTCGHLACVEPHTGAGGEPEATAGRKATGAHEGATGAAPREAYATVLVNTRRARRAHKHS